MFSGSGSRSVWKLGKNFWPRLRLPASGSISGIARSWVAWHLYVLFISIKVSPDSDSSVQWFCGVQSCYAPIGLLEQAVDSLRHEEAGTYGGPFVTWTGFRSKAGVRHWDGCSLEGGFSLTEFDRIGQIWPLLG